MSQTEMKRVTGLLIIEVQNSNPNGDPDRESDPRQRPDEHGEISPVSFKRKLRDLVEQKDGPVWKEMASGINPPLKVATHGILESRDTKRSEAVADARAGRLNEKYWDARVFGNTLLERREKAEDKHLRTGVAQFGLGVSVAPIFVERMTTTKKAPAQEDKTRGMAPLGFRIVRHAVYTMPFFINPTAAVKTGCSKEDIDLLLKLIRYAYPHTASYIRPSVEIRHAWCMEHKSALGSCSDFALIAALTPKKRVDPERPSQTWDEYEIPTELPESLREKLEDFRDLVAL